MMGRQISRGTPEQFRNAVERQIAALGGGDAHVESATNSCGIPAKSDIIEECGDTKIQAAKGTPKQFRNAVQQRLDELGGDDAIESAIVTHMVDPELREFPVEDVIEFLDSKGYDGNSQQVRNYADGVAEYMDMSREAYHDQGMDWPYTLDQWYKDTLQNYPAELEELPTKYDDIDSACNSCNMMSAAEHIDEITYDVVEAGDTDDVDDVDDEDMEPIEGADDLDDYESEPNSTSVDDAYIEELKSELDKWAADSGSDWIESLQYDKDDDNFYIDVVQTAEGETAQIHNYTIPFADLTLNTEEIDTDVDYITAAISALDAYDDYDEIDADNRDWQQLDTKQVQDSDGFYTDYTLYEYQGDPEDVGGDIYICMFGDRDLYSPDVDYADYATDNLREAEDWFSTYNGIYDEDDWED